MGVGGEMRGGSGWGGRGDEREWEGEMRGSGRGR